MMHENQTHLTESTNEYYVSAVASLPKTRILKNEDTFAIFDVKGDVYRIGNDELGIYHNGTRFLSRLIFYIGEKEEPLLLNSFIRKENDYLKIELTNPDIVRSDLPHIKKSTLYISRTKILNDCGCDEAIEFHNYANEPVHLPIAIEFDADYRDVFEIRGMHRERVGTRLPTEINTHSAVLGYKGLDNVHRYTTIQFSDTPNFVSNRRAILQLHIPAQGNQRIELRFRFSEEKVEVPRIAFEKNLRELHFRCGLERSAYASIQTSSDDLNEWIDRSLNDLIMMTTEADGHRFPYAGIPWYCTAFGRDGIWTAMMCLWVNPEMARDVLLFLAKTQATEFDEEHAAEPGKIIHELRGGEMANLGEVPFGRYYGSVDGTPLFLMLAGEYFDRTNDEETIDQLWPALQAAATWIDEYGDMDGDGFIEYSTNSVKGLINQGWKDSHDSVFHADGSDPVGPIALCEPQGYVYCGKMHLSKIARARGEFEYADRLERQAIALKERFDKAYWMPALKSYALALDGNKKPCKVQSSNPGHLFYCGIMKEERVQPTADTLMSDEMFSGWGIRTVGTKEKRYNPISYHNGSVWPHDTTIIAMGMARYGLKGYAEQLFQGLFKAIRFMEHARMPEVFCGFIMDQEPPTLYPVACSPQAWAAASVYGLIQALLGIEIDGKRKLVRSHKPALPPGVQELRIHNLSVDVCQLDIAVVRYREDVSVRLLGRVGDANLIIEK